MMHFQVVLCETFINVTFQDGGRAFCGVLRHPGEPAQCGRVMAAEEFPVVRQVSVGVSG